MLARSIGSGPTILIPAFGTTVPSVHAVLVQTTHPFAIPIGFSAARLPVTLAATTILACLAVASAVAFQARGAASTVYAGVAVPRPEPQPLLEERPRSPVPAPASTAMTLPGVAALPSLTALPSLVAQPSPAVTAFESAPPQPELPIAPVTADHASEAVPEPRDRTSATFVGVWAPDSNACSPRLNRKRLLPAVINEAGAFAGETSCAFRNARAAGAGWTVSATCSNPNGRWATQVRLVVAGNRLTWSSPRGTQTYVRCESMTRRAEQSRTNARG